MAFIVLCCPFSIFWPPACIIFSLLIKCFGAIIIVRAVSAVSAHTNTNAYAREEKWKFDIRHTLFLTFIVVVVDDIAFIVIVIILAISNA